MTLDKAIEVLRSSFSDPTAVTGDDLATARELAIDALSAVRNIRGSCGACLPYLLLGETAPEDDLK